MMNNLVLALANDAEYATVKKLLKKESLDDNQRAKLLWHMARAYSETDRIPILNNIAKNYPDSF